MIRGEKIKSGRLSALVKIVVIKLVSGEKILEGLCDLQGFKFYFIIESHFRRRQYI